MWSSQPLISIGRHRCRLVMSARTSITCRLIGASRHGARFFVDQTKWIPTRTMDLDTTPPPTLWPRAADSASSICNAHRPFDATGIAQLSWQGRAYARPWPGTDQGRGVHRREELKQTGPPSRMDPSRPRGAARYRLSSCRRSMIILRRSEPSCTRSPTRTTEPPRRAGSAAKRTSASLPSALVKAIRPPLAAA